MTWLEVLLRDPIFLAKYSIERLDSGNCCSDELTVFRELGLVEHTDCPCCDEVSSYEERRCLCFACEFQFLTNPEVFEITFNGRKDKENG